MTSDWKETVSSAPEEFGFTSSLFTASRIPAVLLVPGLARTSTGLRKNRKAHTREALLRLSCSSSSGTSRAVFSSSSVRRFLGLGISETTSLFLVCLHRARKKHTHPSSAPFDKRPSSRGGMGSVPVDHSTQPTHSHWSESTLPRGEQTSLRKTPSLVGSTYQPFNTNIVSSRALRFLFWGGGGGFGY